MGRRGREGTEDLNPFFIWSVTVKFFPFARIEARF